MNIPKITIEQHMNGYYLRFGDNKFNKSKKNIKELKSYIEDLENESRYE